MTDLHPPAKHMPECCASTHPAELERQIMDSSLPKNDREWWAAREIEKLREEVAAKKVFPITELDKIMARQALRRGALAGYPIPACSCFNGSRGLLVRNCYGLCDDAVDHVARVMAQVREGEREAIRQRFRDRHLGGFLEVIDDAN